MAAIAMALLLALGGAPKAPAKKALLKIDVKPAAAIVYVDGKRKGTGATVKTLTLTPGPHTIKIVHKKDEHQEVLAVKPGPMSWGWSFEDDRPKSPEPTKGTAEDPPR
jgi:hypothetical protein